MRCNLFPRRLIRIKRFVRFGWQILTFAATFGFSVQLLRSDPVPPDYFGVNVHRLGAWSSGNLPTIRMAAGINWASIETRRGVYDWRALDQWIGTAQTHRADVMFTLLGTPPWASTTPKAKCIDGPGQCAPPKQMQFWEDWVRAVVGHAAGRINQWEIWNEPNLRDYWTGDVKVLADMACRAYSIIKGIDSQAVVLTPSPTRNGDQFPQDWMRLYLAAGGGACADVIAFHGYTWGVWVPEDINRIAAEMKAVMAAFGQGNKPLWNTEGGWGRNNNVPDPDAQAAFLARQYLLQWSSGVSRFYWYAYDDSQWGTLWNATEGLTKAGKAFQELRVWMAGATLLGKCTATDRAWTCPFIRQGGYKAIAVWDPDRQTKYSPPPEYTRFRDLGGNVHEINGEVPIGPSPILIEHVAPRR
jgi:hypothetical protein